MAPTLLSMAGVQAPAPHDRRGPVAAVPRPAGCRERDYAYGGYANSFFIRTRALGDVGRTSRAGFRLFDLQHDPGQFHNVAHRHPGARRPASTAIVRARAGGRLPYYASTGG